ncbi:MAG: AAA family ATPase [Gemmatimonadetes bacterium]|nr:AAA family ATPase [Gemmatimonadota bacterium]
MAAHLEIRLLGTLTVLRGGTVVPLPPSKKARALLAYLVATGRPHLRERLCDLLWDGPSDPRAELRWSLSRIRPVVDDAPLRRLEADHERVWFEPIGARVDLPDLRAQLQPDPAAVSVSVLENAAAAMHGELLEGLDLPACYRYHAWCVAEREGVRALQGAVLGALAERLTDRPEKALAYARAWVTADPFAQPAHVHVIRLLDELGRPRDALEYYDECRRMLARELGAVPMEIEVARQRIHRPARVPLTSVPPERGLPADREQPAQQDVPPLVGRDAECALLSEAVASGAAGAPTSPVLILGEPGIGKTRLLHELVAQVRSREGMVLSGRPFEAEMVRPYGAWIDALRGLSLARVPERLRKPLSTLLPLAGAGSAAHRQELFDAVVELLAVLTTDGPVALVIDDLQWLDEASAALLHFVMRTASRGACPLFAMAGRPVELEENAAVLTVVRALKRDRNLTELELTNLDTESTAVLAGSVAPGADAARVYADSGGNPLYAIEVARALARNEASPSDTLDRLIDERLARLPPHVRELLPWAAALGRSFELELLGRVADVKPTELIRRVAELERWRVLQSNDTAPDSYDFTHDLVRQGAYRRLSGPRRRLTHAHIARVLAALPDPDGELAADLAHHAALAGDSETAARACLLAGERCLRIFAHQEAAELARRGLQHAERLGVVDRLNLQAELHRLFVHAGAARGREREIEAEIARVVSAAEGAGLAGAAHIALHALSYLHWRDGDFARAASDSLRSAEAARAADPRITAHALADTARCLAHLDRDLPQAEALLDEAETIATRLAIELVDIPWARGLLRQYSGDYDDAVRHFTRALGIARTEQHRWGECDCLTHLTMLDLETGQPRRALERCAVLRSVAEKMGEGSEAPFAAALEALARHALREDDAASKLDAALAELRRIDSNLLLAYTLTFAAEVDLQGGDTAAAEQKADAALSAARRVGGRNMSVLANTLLVRVAREQGQTAVVSHRVEALKAALAATANLSARAHQSALAALDARIPTPVPPLDPPPGR